MGDFATKYFQLMSLAGFIVLILLAILAFCDIQYLKIKKGENVKSGIILLIVALIYGTISAYLYYRQNKLENSSRRNSEITGHYNIQGNLNVTTN
jgi:uncharacterized membrane protein (DUF485 family)